MSGITKAEHIRFVEETDPKFASSLDEQKAVFCQLSVGEVHRRIAETHRRIEERLQRASLHPLYKTWLCQYGSTCKQIKNCRFAHSLLAWIAFGSFHDPNFKTEFCELDDACTRKNECFKVHPGDPFHLKRPYDGIDQWIIWNPIQIDTEELIMGPSSYDFLRRSPVSTDLLVGPAMYDFLTKSPVDQSGLASPVEFSNAVQREEEEVWMLKSITADDSSQSV